MMLYDITSQHFFFLHVERHANIGNLLILYKQMSELGLVK